MILIVAALADRLSAATFKVERGRIEKDQVHFGEQIASAFEERFLNEVFVASRHAQDLFA
jgi:hypothetical protein